jgi:putative endonuclease
MAYYVYIMMNEDNTRHYIGFTNNLARKVQKYKTDLTTYVGKNGLTKLVYYEKHDEFAEAKRREEVVKDWEKDYLKNILKISNKKYEDLFPRLMKNITFKN